MARFKYAYLLAASTSSSFDHTSPSGAAAPHAGIYRCQACGREVVADKGVPLPSDGHHEHAASMGPIRWRLAVATQE